MMFPNKEKILPYVHDDMVGGPQGDYHSKVDAAVLLPFFFIDFAIARYLINKSKF